MGSVGGGRGAVADTHPPPGTVKGPVERSDTEVAADLLRPLLDRHDDLMIEVEGTGGTSHPEALAVAVIDTTGSVLLDTVSLPQGPILARASQMGARPWPDVHAEVEELRRRAPVVIAWDGKKGAESAGEDSREALPGVAARELAPFPPSRQRLDRESTVGGLELWAYSRSGATGFYPKHRRCSQ